MNSPRYIAIGDIHGCARSLDAMLGKLKPHDDRIHIFIGDYIDRGPDSRLVVKHLMNFTDVHTCIFLRGNHENMLLEALSTGNELLWHLNGGVSTLESYGVQSVAGIPRDHIRFFEDTRLWYNTDEYLFIHAGLDPERTVQQQLDDPATEEAALWERSHIDSPTQWEKTVVFGHTPVPEPITDNRKIGIDTGCVFARPGLGKLTAVLLPEMTFIEQPCLD